MTKTCKRRLVFKVDIELDNDTVMLLFSFNFLS